MKTLCTVLTAAALSLAMLAPAASAEPAEDDDGIEYDCGAAYDDVRVKHERVVSDTIRTTIMIDSLTLHNRTLSLNRETPHRAREKRFPVVRYDLSTNTLTLNGKPCREKK
jgi:hypothetical protein